MDKIKRLRQLQQQKNALVDQANELLAKEQPTDEDLKAVQEKQAEAQKLVQQIDLLTAQIELDRGAEAVKEATADDEGVEVVAEDVSTPKLFKNFGEQMQAIFAAYKSKMQNIDERLMKINEFGDKRAAAAGGAAAVGSDGGFLIQSDFATEILKKAYEVGSLVSRCRRATVSPNSDRLIIPYVDETSRATGSRWGGVQTYWANEADTATAKKPKIGKLEVPLHKLLGIAYMTRELFEDASAMSMIYRDAFAEEIAFMVENGIVNGTGAGQLLGILNASALISVSKETAQEAASLYPENINKMYSRMWARSRANAVWLHNQDIEPQLFGMYQTIGTGGVPVFLPPNGLSQSPYGTLMGRPLLPTEYNATLGTVGDLLLADLSQYLLLEKGELRVDMSEHVNFASDEIAMRFVFRVGGQPLWTSAVTPFKGTNTLSPFVALATRS